MVTVDELRAKEISIREKLATVRTDLAALKVVLADSARAKEQIAAADGPNDGAYRKLADERFGDLRDRAGLTLAAEADRDRLRTHETALLVELEENREALARAGAPRLVIPMLANIPKAAPCPMRWADMTGDGDERICTRCHRVARNVAFLDPRDGSTFPAADLHAPFHRRVDGTILTGNCEIGEHQERLTRAMAIGLGVIVAIVAGVLVSFEVAKKPPPPPPLAAALPRNMGPYNIYDHPPGYRGDAPPTMPVGVYQDRLHNVSAIHLVETLVDHGTSRKIDLRISPMGNRFAGFLTCNGSNDPQLADVAMITIQSFLDEINATPDADLDAGTPPTCSRTAPTRKAQIDFVMPGPKNTTTLTMNSCGQWSENGKLLRPENPLSQDAFTSRINVRYKNIVLALPRTACTPKSGAALVSP